MAGKFSAVFIAAALTVALCLVGCGGDGETATKKAAPAEGENVSTVAASSKSGYLDRPELLEEAAAICTRVKEETDKDLERFNSDHAIDASQDLTPDVEREIGEEIILPNAYKQTREIINLGVRHGRLEDESEKVMTAFVDAIEKGEQHPAVAATETARLFQNANQMAQSFGFGSCQTG